nr:hypothetical protein [Tanacetum cinerariifolium]
MQPDTSARFHFSVMEGFINRLLMIEPTLIDLYELACKVEDALRVKPDKIKKRKADEEVNDRQVTKRTEGFFFEPVSKKRTTALGGRHACSCDDCGTSTSSKNDEIGSSSEACSIYKR